MHVRLSKLREGERGIVIDIQGGVGARQRLLGLGITPGTVVWVIKSSSSGPIIIGVGPSRVALGRGIADKIIVRRES